ncbi:glycoside hydrolase superfamily [Cadophora sp. MPI-SDFR-AT-0126]|nr:glycoside hydrolase superfamily [Leotiomycetes sp. MPI-SDFR-AT-0126]
MRFSTSFIAAAGLSASVFAAPITDVANDDCDFEAPSSSAATGNGLLIWFSIFTHICLVVSSTIPLMSSAAIPVTDSLPSSTSIVVPSTTAPASEASSSTAVAAVVVATGTSNSTGALQWLGVNESGAEFGQANIPGVLGTDYTWPLTTTIDTLTGKGMNIFRIPFLMERLAQGTMTVALDKTYLGDLSSLVSHITAAGAYAVLDPHNFGRYGGSVFTSTSDFQTFWTNVATEFKTDDKVIFDCNNEFHDMPSNQLVADLNQACIDGVRAAGATTQYVFVEGTSYTGAWTWTTSGNSDVMGNLTDPSDKIVYEMHQYLDSDGSGTSDVCVSSTIGAERVAEATKWLQANGKKGIIGEFAGGANDVCKSAVTGLLDSLVAASDVWMGAMWWGGGPWWGDYIFSFEPAAGTGYVAYMDTLAKYI